MSNQDQRVLSVLFTAAFAAILLVVFAGSAEAGGSNFKDNFDQFNDNRWTKSSFNLGRSQLDPSNVSVRNSNLRIKIPAQSLNGGEIESRALYGYGTYVARMRVPNAPSSITGFFLYRSPDYEAELDIELYNNSSRRVDYTTYANGKQTHFAAKKLPFDATKGFHTYRIDYYPRVVRFYADGKLYQRYKYGLPDGEMKLLINTWFPNWLSGQKPTKASATYVDWVYYRQ